MFVLVYYSVPSMFKRGTPFGRPSKGPSESQVVGGPGVSFTENFWVLFERLVYVVNKTVEETVVDGDREPTPSTEVLSTP